MSQPTPSNEEQLQKQQELEAKKQMMLSQILDPDARERLHRIELVKPETARMVEENLLRQAQRGQLKEKVTESQLKTLLSQVSESSHKSAGKISIVRKKKAKRDSDDDDDDWEM